MASDLRFSPGDFIGYKNHGKKHVAIVREPLEGRIKVAPLEKTASLDHFMFLLLREEAVSLDQVFLVGGTWRNSPIMFRMPDQQIDNSHVDEIRPLSFITVNKTEIAVTLGSCFQIDKTDFSYDGERISAGTECYRGHFLKRNKSCPGWYYYRLDTESCFIPVTTITGCGIKMLFCDQMDDSVTEVRKFPEIEIDIRDFEVSQITRVGDGHAEQEQDAVENGHKKKRAAEEANEQVDDYMITASAKKQQKTDA
jgi:hypothetical protein